MTRLFLLMLLPLLAACGLDNATRLQAEQVIGSMAETEAKITSIKKEFEQAVSSSTIPNVRASVESAKLREQFKDVDRGLVKAHACVDDLKALLEANRSKQKQEVVQRSEICTQHMQNDLDAAKDPLRRLRLWEQLYKEADTYLARADRETQAVDTILLGLEPNGELLKFYVQKMQEFPDKRDDIAARIADVLKEQSTMHAQLELARVQVGSLSADTSSFDVFALETALTNRDDAQQIIDTALDDLESRVDQLDESWSVVLSGLTRTCVFKLQLTQWRWNSETYGDGRSTVLGWRDVTEDKWFNTPEDAVVDSSGSDWGSGSSTEVSDKDIVCSHKMTTYEVHDGELTDEVTTPVDEDLFEDYYVAARRMHDMFPDSGVIRSIEVSKRVDPSDPKPPKAKYLPVPLGVQMSLSMVIETKSKGQYEDEASDQPSPEDVPLQYVGDPTYGEWREEGGQRRWFWNDFALGYLYGSRVSYIHPVYWSMYDPYDTWIDRNDWRHQRRRTVYSSGSYRTSYRSAVPGSRSHRSRSVRGAGPSSRARGMGGGGK